MKPTLLVLAAGMGSRYGGLKQMDGLGPNGETIIDYSIYDAVKAGFGKVVYIVRESFKDQFEESVRNKYRNVRCADGTPLEFVFVTQELDRIPSGFTVNPDRVKPWGTAHAILMASEVIDEPFAVINGDDYYGNDSFGVLGKWLSSLKKDENRFCIVGFELHNTLSESGGVSRGICSYDKDGHLTHIEEHLDIHVEDDGEIRGNNAGGERVRLDGNTLCSMNMWGFTPEFFKEGWRLFKEFLEENSAELKKEFYIPYVVDCMIKAGKVTTDVLSSPSRWFGVTYKEDRPAVVEKFKDLVDKGVYPSPLY